MRLTIVMDLDNSAFENTPHLEVRRILGECADKFSKQLSRVGGCVCDAPESADKLYDYNGNCVGKITLERE